MYIYYILLLNFLETWTILSRKVRIWAFLSTPEGYLYFKLSPEYEVYCVRLCGFRHKPAHEITCEATTLGKAFSRCVQMQHWFWPGRLSVLWGWAPETSKHPRASSSFRLLSTKACLVVSLSMLGDVSNAVAFALFFVFHDHDHSNKFLFAYGSSYPQEQEKCVLEFSFVFSWALPVNIYLG